MNSSAGNAKVAAIFYLMFGLFAAAALGIWIFTPPATPISVILADPEGAVLLGVGLFLALASLGMTTWVFIKPEIGWVHVICGVVLVAISAAWNIIAVLFWAVPLLFLVKARRTP